jgi:hypothetical protein
MKASSRVAIAFAATSLALVIATIMIIVLA